MVQLLAAFVLAASIFCQQQQPAGQPLGQSPVPTMVELHEMYEAGDFRMCVQQIGRVMRLKGKAAEPYNIDELQLLRGKSLLALQDATFARRALQEALKSTQTEVAVPARALSALISRSSGGSYHPKSRGGERINIYDPATRTDAMRAVLDDEISAIESDAKRAAADKTLATSLKVMPRLIDLYCIERVVTDGGDERTGPVARAVGEHARTIIDRELALQEERIIGIERMANQMVSSGRNWRQGRRGWDDDYARRGLISDERAALDELVQYLAQVEDTARQAQQVALTMGGDTKAWDGVVTRAATVRTHAEAVLEAEGVRTVDTTRQ